MTRALAVSPLPGEDAEAVLRRYLAGRHMLLAVDNFEHVLDGAELIAGLLAESDVLTVLATSREPLNVAAEHRFLLQPLALPAQPDRATVAEVQSAPASALFLAAARRHDAAFEVSPMTASAVAQICARLDGLPLALELAAARTAVYSVSELVGDLGDTLGEVAGAPRDAPARHRTLRATIEWSHRLLNEQERAALASSRSSPAARRSAAPGPSPAPLRRLLPPSPRRTFCFAAIKRTERLASSCWKPSGTTP